MGRKVDKKLTICRTETAGGQYETPKVDNLLKKTRRRPKCDTKVTQTKKNTTNEKQKHHKNKRNEISMKNKFKYIINHGFSH